MDKIRMVSRAYSNLLPLDVADCKLGSSSIYVLQPNQAAMLLTRSHPFPRESPLSMFLLTFYDTSISVLALS